MIRIGPLADRGMANGWPTGRVLNVRNRVAIGCAMLLLAVLPVRASDGLDMVSVMDGICLKALETGSSVGPGLIRADAAMETRLLHGKNGKIWRTPNSRIVVVGHTSGHTCEVMGINITASDFASALRKWNDADGSRYAVDADENISDTGPGGAYLARQTPEGNFVQVFIQSQPEARFIGITASRVSESALAREVLGE